MRNDESFISRIFEAIKQKVKTVGVMVSGGKTSLYLGECDKKQLFVGNVVNSTFTSLNENLWILNISRITLYEENQFESTVSSQAYSGIIDMSTDAIIFPKVKTSSGIIRELRATD